MIVALEVAVIVCVTLSVDVVVVEAVDEEVGTDVIVDCNWFNTSMLLPSIAITQSRSLGS